MKIYLDFDGVISDCGKLKSEGAKKLYRIEILPEKFKKEIVVGEGILTLEQYYDLQIKIYGTRELGLLMEPVHGMLEHISMMQKEGHNLKVVTSRGKKEFEIAKEWMRKYDLNVSAVGVGPGVSKADACRGADVYLDDDLDKLEPLVGVVPSRYLFSWGYNQHIEVPQEVAKRISSWKSFYEEIQRLDSY